MNLKSCLVTFSALTVLTSAPVAANQSVGFIPQDSQAQGPTRVVLYGLADVSVENVSNGGGGEMRISSGTSAGSRWGIRGTEDLGGGYRAVFVVESRVEMDTGRSTTSSQFLAPAPAPPTGVPGSVWQTTWNALLTKATTVNGDEALFDRQAFVGLITPVGGFLAGRMYTPGYEILNAFNVYGDATAGQFGQGFAALAIRANNALAYRIAKNGWTSTVMYSVGGIDGVNSRNEYAGTHKKADDFWGANLRYTTPDWDVGIGYNRNNTYRFADASSATVVGSQKGLSTLNLGGSMRFGDWRVFAMAMQRKNDNPVVRVSADGVSGAELLALSRRSSLLSFQDADLVVGQAEVTDMRIYHLGAAYK